MSTEQTSTVAVLIGTVLVALGSYAIYNLFFHPLAGIPGPILCCSGFYSYPLVRAIKRDASFQWERLHQRYGQYVRIGPNQVITVDEAAWKDIYSLHTKWTKGTVYHFFGVGSTKSLMSETDEKKHAVIRRMLAPSYTTGALKELEPYVDEVIQVFDKKLRVIARNKEPLDASVWITWFAADIIGQLAFGQPFGLLESESDSNNLMEALDKNIYLAVIQGMLPYRIGMMVRSILVSLTPILGASSGTGHLRQFTVKSVKMRADRIAEREKEGGSENERKDMLTQFLKARNPQTGKQFTFPELCTTVGSLVGAGADTTAISIRSVLYYTLSTPNVYKRLMGELEEAHENGLLQFPLSYANGCKLEYMQAVIKEAMRHFPAGSFLIPRVSPHGGAHLGGHYFPAGTELSMTTYSFHRRVYGTDSTEFKPERWLRDPNDDEEISARKRKQLDGNFMSFGSGTHTCIGRNISLMEMTKLLPYLFWHYDMKITPRGPGSPHVYPHGRGMDGVEDGEVWFVEGAWFSMQRDFFLDISLRDVDDL